MGERIRVLEVFEPPDGGVGQAVGQLARGLRAHGVDVEVAGPPEAAPYGGLDVPVHRLPLGRDYGDPVREARVLVGLVGILRRGRFDLVHTHSAKAGFLGRLAARTARVPALHSPHCLPFVGDVSPARRRVTAAVERRVGPLTAEMVCVCEHERQVALRHGLLPAQRLSVVHNGSPACDPFGAADERLLALRGDGVLAAAVTVMRPQKGLPDLLRAAPQVLEAVPGARLAVVGSGPERAALELQATVLGLDRHPRFALLPYEGPPERHLRALDVFVLPSRWEAFPLGPLEAMACGVPQVATDVGGTREAVTAQTGRLVPPGDVPALTAALVDLLSDADARRRLGEASRRAHAERFTVERAVAGTAARYRAVLSAAASRGGGGPASA